MATIVKRNGSYRVFVRRKGISKSATFDNKKDAAEWAYQEELNAIKKKNGDDYDQSYQQDSITLNDLCSRYAREISPLKPGYKNELVRFSLFARYGEFTTPINQITPKIIAQWRDRRLKTVKSSTVNRDLNLISAVLNIAIKEWGYNIGANPVHMIMRPKNPKPRRRRISDEEIKKIIDVLGWNQTSEPKKTKEWVAFAFCIAIETAMRRGEILSIQWKDCHIDESYIHLETTKNGEMRDVPLSSKAKTFFKLLKSKGRNRNVVPIPPSILTTTFKRAVLQAGFSDMRFHDARREATSRLAKKVNSVLELAAITGHKDINLLNRVYYGTDVSELAKQIK